MERHSFLALALTVLTGTLSCAPEHGTIVIKQSDIDTKGGWQAALFEGLDPDESLWVAAEDADRCRNKFEEQCYGQGGRPSTQLRVVRLRGVDGGDGVSCAAPCVPQSGTSTVTRAPLAAHRALRGWNVQQPKYRRLHLLDGLSLEWDYFMVHDADERFTGSIGYLLADPRGRLGDFSWLPDLVPSGINAAIAGRFEGGEMVAEFATFGRSPTQGSDSERACHGDAGEQFATLVPYQATDETEDALRMRGRTASMAWDLWVSQDWNQRGSFEATTGHDIGALPGEHWTVEMLWPRTKVVGTITRLDTGEVIAIDGHGYRENSWGRWAFPAGGWDFAILSDEESGVQWAWQTYHPLSDDLDFVDVSFVDDGSLKALHIGGDQLGWDHAEWAFDGAARQCVPQSARVVAADDDYVIDVDLQFAGQQLALLSDATWVTKGYVIMTQFPWISGTITRRATGEEVATFSGRGGGEFSLMRNLIGGGGDRDCSELFRRVFSAPLPE